MIQVNENEASAMQESMKARANPEKASKMEGSPSTRIPFVLTINRAPALGRLPEVVLGSSLGLLSIALAFTRASANASWVEWLYWLGLLLIVLPVAYRLLGSSVSRPESISLVLFLGLSLYLVKVMHSPFLFTYSDELLHLRNASNILQSRFLFADNTILPVSAYYPGLEIVTTAVASLSGLSLFVSGLLVIGLARLVITLSLFLLFEQVSHSTRVAGLAAVLYMANSNFLYWSAQFSYESLSLPLAILVLYIIAKQLRIKNNQTKLGLTFAALLLIAAIIATHHLTAYGIAIFLILLSIIDSFKRVSSKRELFNIWGLAIVTSLLTLSWLFWVARPTTAYLYQIFNGAFGSILHLLSGQPGRALFTSVTGKIAPLWERLVGISSVALIAFGIPSGIYAVWKRRRLNAFALALTGVAALYFISLGMRFTGGGWEVANRATEFLFVGIAFLIAFAFVTLRLRFPRSRYLPFIFAGYAAVLVMGGVIAGWVPGLRLSQPLAVKVDNTVLQPQGVEAAYWMLDEQGSHNKVVAPISDALLMLAYGNQDAQTGKIYGIQELLTTQHELNWQTDILQNLHTRFLVMDRREVSWDNMLGPYFSPLASPSTAGANDLPSEIYTMFDGLPQIPRIFDSGDIVIYDVGGISNVTKTK